MKNILFTLFFLGISINAFSQSSAGLVAHWDMNGTANDASGNGHDGHASNVTLVAGEDGTANSAYYFNGVNSVITVPYASSLNLTNYSICAAVKVMGFYTDWCQVNTILDRGPLTTFGDYAMFFYDNPFDGDNCTLVDTTEDVFICEYGTYGGSYADWQYTPTIIENQWYNVVATWDGAVRKIYINGTLKSTVVSTGGSIGSSTDSISIGMDIFDVGSPNQFKGVIDDIRLYNRVLSDSEIVIYGPDSISCGLTNVQPVADSISVDGTANFSVATTMTTPSYQWQENYGSGFVNLINVPPYSGVTTPTLTISGVGLSLNSTNYRCIISNTNCSDTTHDAKLTVKSSAGINSIVTDDNVTVYPNPTTAMVTIRFQKSSDGNIQLLNEMGQTVLSLEINSRVLELNLCSLPASVYFLKGQNNGSTFYKKIMKL